jgi:VCBS repeat-containing protein
VAGDVGTQITLASGALLTVNSDGSYSYNPNGKFDSLPDASKLTDSFTYTIADSSGEEDDAKVEITITGVNDPPEVNDQSFSIAENSKVGDTVGTVAATDPDAGFVLGYALSDSGGAFAIDNSGNITVADSSKIDFESKAAYSLIVTVSDNAGGSDTATITINVTDANDAPTVVAPVADVEVNEGAAPTVIDISGVFADQDAGDKLTISVTNDNPALATATLSLDGKMLTVAYAPDAFGKANIALTATDTLGAKVSDAFVVNVANVNDPVDAMDDLFTTPENTTLTGNVLTNDVDPDGDTLSAFLNTTTTKGTLSFQTNGSFTYTPNASFAGEDSFTYTVSDGKGSTDTAKVTITVTNVNQLPDAKDDSFTTDRNTAVSGNVLANDTDPDGEKLFASLVTAPANGKAVLNSDGSFSYTPNSGFVGTDSFTYTASDGSGGSDTAKVEIKVLAPVNLDATDDSFSKNEDEVVTGNLLANDIDPEGDAFSLISTTAPSSGTLISDAKGNFTYTPFPNFFGTDSFTYTIQDAKGFTDTAKVTLTFAPVNDIDAVNDTFATDEDKALTVNAPGVLGNDFEPDINAEHKFAIVGVIPAIGSTSKGGTFDIKADGSFTYTPAANFAGADTFSYTIEDSAGAKDTATVTINVGQKNDAPVAVNDTANASEDSSNNFIDVLNNDSDVDGDKFFVSAITHGSNGTVQIVPGPDDPDPG